MIELPCQSVVCKSLVLMLVIIHFQQDLQHLLGTCIYIGIIYWTALVMYTH
jgi:hypothetical protein